MTSQTRLIMSQMDDIPAWRQSREAAKNTTCINSHPAANAQTINQPTSHLQKEPAIATSLRPDHPRVFRCVGGSVASERWTSWEHIDICRMLEMKIDALLAGKPV